MGLEVDSYSSRAAINQPVQSERTLRFPEEGTYKIAVSVRLLFGPDRSLGTSGVLFFVIDASGSRVTDMDPDAHRPERHDPSNQVTVTTTPSNSVTAPNEDPCFTIFVHAERIDRVSTPDGYSAPFIIPMAGMGIEISRIRSSI